MPESLMTNALPLPRRGSFGIAILLGVWAGGVALAPSWPVKAALVAPALLIPGIWWMLQRPLRWVTVFLAATILLPPLPIALGDSGPHPALAIAAFGLLAGAIWLPRWRIALSGPGAALTFLSFVLAASLAPAALTAGPEAVAAAAARVGLFAIAPFVYLYVSQGPAGRCDKLRLTRALFAMATLSAAFACVDFYFQFPAPAGFGAQYIWVDSEVYRRAQGLFYEASTLGNFCVFFLTMAAAAIAKGIEIPRLLLATGVPLLTGALVLSFSRGSLVALAFALGVLAWMHRRKIAAGKLALWFLVAAPAAAWLLRRTVPAVVEHYWLRLSLSAEFLFSSTEGVLSGRVASWRTLLAWMSDHPWQLLTGIGYKTLPYTSHLGQPVVADNMYLSLLIETGIAGLAALLWLNLSILRASLRASRSADRHRSFLGCWMFCFWAAESVQMFSGDLLTYWRVLPIYFFVLGLAVRE